MATVNRSQQVSLSLPTAVFDPECSHASVGLSGALLREALPRPVCARSAVTSLPAVRSACARRRTGRGGRCPVGGGREGCCRTATQPHGRLAAQGPSYAPIKLSGDTAVRPHGCLAARRSTYRAFRPSSYPAIRPGCPDSLTGAGAAGATAAPVLRRRQRRRSRGSLRAGVAADRRDEATGPSPARRSQRRSSEADFSGPAPRRSTQPKLRRGARQPAPRLAAAPHSDTFARGAARQWPEVHDLSHILHVAKVRRPQILARPWVFRLAQLATSSDGWGRCLAAPPPRLAARAPRVTARSSARPAPASWRCVSKQAPSPLRRRHGAQRRVLARRASTRGIPSTAGG